MQLSFPSALTIVVAFISLSAQAVPAPAPAAQETCQKVGSCVSALRPYSSAASLCSSWLTLTPRTITKMVTSGLAISTVKATTTTGTHVITAAAVTRGDSTRTVTATIITSTVSADPVTVAGEITTITETGSTATVTNIVTTTICGSVLEARALVEERSPANAKAPKVVPSPLKKFDQSKIMAGCSCLSLKVRTSTVYKTVKGSKTITQVIRTAAVTTVTPTTDFTAVTTISQTETTTVTSTATSTPSTTVTTIPTTIIEEVKTVIIGPQVGTPTVVLASPTPITGVNSAGLATENVDDSPTFPLELPFELELYGVRSSSISVSINGWVSVGNSVVSEYRNTPLPVSLLGDTVFSAYWYDLYVYVDTPQGLYYEVAGEAGSRTLAIEWYTSLYRNPVGYTHFIAKFFEAEPGKVVYTYYQTTAERSTTNGNNYGTIGAQSLSKDKFAQYSYDVVPEPGLEIELNTVTNMFVRTNQQTCPV